MKKYSDVFFAAVLSAGLALAGCGGRSEKGLGTEENPLILALSAPYAENLTPEDSAALEKLLSAETSLSVKIRSYRDSLSVIRALGERKADAAFLTLDEYLLAREEYKAEPLLRVLRGKGDREYGGAIFVADRKLGSVKDLQGKKVAMSNPYSLSGFILPGLVFAENGVKIEPVFTGSHEISVRELLKGEVSAAAVYRSMGAKYKQLIMLAPTEMVPNEPVAVRKGLDPDIKKKTAHALMKISKEPKNAALVKKIADITGFEKVEPGSYARIHQKLRDSGKSLYSVIPDGIKLKKLSEPYYFD